MAASRVELTDNSDIFRTELRQRIPIALEAIGLYMQSEWVKEITNQDVIDTGRFRNSIDHVMSGDAVLVGTPLDYPISLEFGTPTMPARPTLTDTVNREKSNLKPIFKRIMEQG